MEDQPQSNPPQDPTKESQVAEKKSPIDKLKSLVLPTDKKQRNKILLIAGGILIIGGLISFMVWGMAVWAMAYFMGEPNGGCFGDLKDVKPTSNWRNDVMTTTFAGCGADGKCADPQDNCRGSGGISTGCDAPTQLFAALPYPVSKTCKGDVNKCPKIEVANPKNSKSVVLAVVDTGPCNTTDKEYVINGAEPQVRKGVGIGGCNAKNPAELDISPTAMKDLEGGSGDHFNWRFVDAGSLRDSCSADIEMQFVYGNLVVIDPGHKSGYNRYKRSINGTDNEGDDNWNIANKVKTKVESKGFSVLLTKNSAAEDPTLQQRAEFANSKNAALFVSLHSNDSGGAGPWGIVYCAGKGAEADDGKVNYKTESCTTDASAIRGKSASHSIVENILSQIKLKNPTYKGGDLGVLNGLKMPGTLIEMYAHDKSEDIEKIDGKADQLAGAIADGILEVMKKN